MDQPKCLINASYLLSYLFIYYYVAIFGKERQDSCFKVKTTSARSQTCSSASGHYHSELQKSEDWVPEAQNSGAQKTKAIALWKTSPSKVIALCCLLEHFTLHWEAIKTITRSLVKVIIFFKIQKILPE